MPKTIPKSPSDELIFVPEGHKYFKGKKRIPSVSEILQKVGLSKEYVGIDPFYRERGTATHLAIKLYLQGNLDISSLDPAIQPQFEAFLTYWKAHTDEEIIALEKPMCDSNESFAGTPDLVTKVAIYDWKCTKSHDKAADLQGQAYKILNRKIGFLPFLLVELHDDASFAEFNYGTGSEIWDPVMKLYQWRVNR